MAKAKKRAQAVPSEPSGLPEIDRKSKQKTDMIPREEWGARLTAALQRADLSGSEAARLLGVKQESLWSYIGGKKAPSAAMLERWHRVLGLDPRILMPEFFGVSLKSGIFPGHSGPPFAMRAISRSGPPYPQCSTAAFQPRSSSPGRS